MRKEKILVGVIGLLILMTSLSVISCKPKLVSAEATDAGNTACPVSGDKVSGKHFVEYKGKRYGMCCPVCKNKFNKDPEKWIASLDNPQAAEHEHMH